MTRLFGKKDKTTIAELEEYYSTTGKKNRSGMAWLMAFLSIALTIIVIVALFFLGRWIYRSLTDDNDSTTTISETEGGSIDLPNFDGSIVGQGNPQESATTGTSEAGGVVSDQAAVTVTEGNSSSASVSGATTPTNTATTTQTGGDIPNTGADEIVILLPLAVGIVGYAISRKRQLKQD